MSSPTSPANGAGASPPSTVLRLDGADALSLLHRISTNALLDLAAGESRATLFCDFRGRLQHRAVVVVAPDLAVWLLRAGAPGAPLAAFLDRHIFREDVRVTDRSAVLRARWEPDEEAPAGPASFAGDIPARLADAGRLLVVESVAAPAEDTATLVAEGRRIALGVPAHGHEIVEAFNPFEVGLGDEVHLDKGCFTGQEALMRLVTYRSVRRQLARVEGAGDPPETPADARAGGEVVGVVTTAIAGATPGHWIGLAVIRTDRVTGQAEIVVGGRALLERIEPFPARRPHGRPWAA